VAGSEPTLSSDLLEHTIETAQGPVDMLAEVVIEDDGKTLHLKDVTIFGRGAQALTGLTKDILQTKKHLANLARSHGFEKLRITGDRVRTSTSANKGKHIDVTVVLT
jgi:hypothetical protein